MKILSTMCYILAAICLIAGLLVTSCNEQDIGTTENCRILCVYDRELNGHNFVVSGAGGIIHAPYCKCFGVTDTMKVDTMIAIEIDSNVYNELLKMQKKQFLNQWNETIESIDKNQIVH